MYTYIYQDLIHDILVVVLLPSLSLCAKLIYEHRFSCIRNLFIARRESASMCVILIHLSFVYWILCFFHLFLFFLLDTLLLNIHMVPFFVCHITEYKLNSVYEFSTKQKKKNSLLVHFVYIIYICHHTATEG